MANQIDPLILELRVDDKQFKTRLADIERVSDKRLRSIEASGVKMGQGVSRGFNLAKGAAVGFIASLGVDAVVQAIKAGLDYASSLGEVAQQLGVTTDALQEYRYAGSQAGLATEEIDMALGQLTRRIGEGVNGTKAQADAFKKLGISLKDAKGNVIATGDAIPLIADALQKIKSPAEQSAILLDLFGKSGAKLLPLLSEGSKGVNGLRDAAQKLGLVLSSEQIAKADETADKLDAVRQVLAAKIAGTVADNADSILALADALTAIVGAAGKAISALNEFYKVAANKPGNLFEKITGTNIGTGAPIRSADYLVGRQEMKANAARGGAYSPTGRRGGFVAGKNFAGNGLAGILGFEGLGAPGAGTGADIKALGGLIDVFSQPAAKVAKKLDEWALELDRVTADVAVARAQLSGNPAQILAAEKQQIEAKRIADEAAILGDAKNKSVRAQLIKLNNENAQIAVAIAEREAANEAARKSAEIADQRLGQEIDALNDEGRTLALQASLTANREARLALAKRMLDIQYEVERKELEAAIAAGKIADADAARARLKQRQLLDEQQLGKDNARPVAQYLDQLQNKDFGFDAEKIGVDGVRELNSELAKAAIYGGDVGDILENSFKRAAAALVEVALELLVVKPLLESLRGAGSGGGIASLIGSIGGLFGGPRASGGPVSAGKFYRVNETQQEFFRPNTSGVIHTVGQLARQNAAGGRPLAQQPIIIQVHADEGGTFVPRVEAISAGVSVEVVRIAGPQIQKAAVNETFRQASRPGMGR